MILGSPVPRFTTVGYIASVTRKAVVVEPNGSGETRKSMVDEGCATSTFTAVTAKSDRPSEVAEKYV